MKHSAATLYQKEGTKKVLASLISILVGLLVGGIAVILVGCFNEKISLSGAWDGFRIIFAGIFSTGRNAAGELTWGFNAVNTGDMLFRATPLIMTGLSVAVAFKTGLFNIGAPGQYLISTMATLMIALSIPSSSVPTWIIWILAFLGGCLAGALWGALPGLAKACLNINEVLACIMTNWVAANLVTWMFDISNFKNTVAAVLAAQVKQLQFYSEARKYESSMEASLDATNVPTSVYLNLLEAVHQNMDKMHRYVRMRKKLLGVDELHFYDVYAPLVAGVNRKIPYEEAKQTIYDALAPMGEGYRQILKEGFDNRWIDVYQNEGKRSGAYSAGARVHPFVLMNYTGTLDSQFTLDHEMGHAIHSYLSNRTQNPIDAGYVIFVAEVASTCNEALLMEHLLSKTTDKKERAYLINHFLEQFKSTLYRQAMFAEFELNIGRMAKEGQTLTADVLSAEYRRLNEMYFGPDMVIDEEIALEWARIPHFYYNYYVFQYATGYSAAIALSRRILREGESAVQDYLGFLSGGCSKSPIDLLKGAGVDMTSPEPVNQALELFGELLDEMEQLMQD